VLKKVSLLLPPPPCFLPALTGVEGGGIRRGYSGGGGGEGQGQKGGAFHKFYTQDVDGTRETSFFGLKFPFCSMVVIYVNLILIISISDILKRSIIGMVL
jgi:hypothetical protein